MDSSPLNPGPKPRISFESCRVAADWDNQDLFPNPSLLARGTAIFMTWVPGTGSASLARARQGRPQTTLSCVHNTGVTRRQPGNVSVIRVLHVNLAQACVEGVLYGIFLVLATTSLLLLIARRWRNHNGTSTLFVGGTLLKSPLVIGILLLFITVSGHWCTTVLRLFRSIDYEDGRHMAEYYLVTEATPHVVASAFVVASVIIGDAIMVYRICIVWNKKLVAIIFPALCICAYIGAGISIVQLFVVFRPEESIFVAASKQRVVTMAALTLSCIAYRIWSINRGMKHERAFSPAVGLSEILVIFVESATLYTSWTFFFLVSYIVSSPLEAFACHCIPAATGISFMLIIVRVGLSFSWEERVGSQLSISVGDLGPAVAPNTIARGQNDFTAVFPLGMIVWVRQTVTAEREEVTDFVLTRVRNNADNDSDSVGHGGESV